MKKSSMEATLPIVVSPSPNSASLTRMISESVDLYAGRLSVEVPLYSLKSGDIELPISLQTSVNSHKVNDIGSWVGIGWHLNAGGVITRVMKSLPDEFNGTINSAYFNYPGIGYINLFTQPEKVDISRFEPVTIPAAPYNILNETERTEMKNIINRGSWNMYGSYFDKGYDLQPDEFYFNFGKYSGKFVFDKSGKPILITEGNLSITPIISNNKITEFTITTDDGYRYEFGNSAYNAVEESKLNISSKSLMLAYRYLGLYKDVTLNVHGKNIQKITGNLPGTSGTDINDVAHKEYLYDTYPYLMSLNFQSSFLKDGKYQASYTPLDMYLDFNYESNKRAYEYFFYNSSWYLRKITSPIGNYITLNYSDNGTLTYIADRVLTSNDPAFLGTYPCCYSNLSAYSKDGAYPTQSTNYDYPHPTTTTLGKSYADPHYEFRAMATYPTFGERTISTQTVELKSKRLSTIVTNQGYRVDFIANTTRLDFTGDKRLDKISIYKDQSSIKEFSFGYDNFYSSESMQTYQFNVKKPVYIYDLNEENRSSTYGQFIGTSFTPYTITETPEVQANMRYRMFLSSVTESGANGESLPPYKFDYYYKDAIPYRTSNKQDQYGFAINTSLPLSGLEAGVLRKVTYPMGGFKEFFFDKSGNNYAWNGLRIKEVKEYESSSAPPISKTFTYGNFIQTDLAVTSYPMADVIRPYVLPTDKYVITGNKTFSSERRINSESQTRGAAGGYDFVEVSQMGNGKHRTEFYTSNDFPDVNATNILVSGFSLGFTSDLISLGYGYPYPQKITNDWQRGLPKAEYFFKNDGITKVKSVHYDYDFSDFSKGGEYALGLQVSKYSIDYTSTWNWMMYGKYGYYPRWQLLKSKEERDYKPDGNSYLRKMAEYTYKKLYDGNKTFLYINEGKSTDSKNEQAVQKFKYPLDYALTNDDVGLGISKLKQYKIYNSVIEKYQFVQKQDGTNKRFVSGMLNLYHSDIPVLKSTLSFLPKFTSSMFVESNTNSGSFIYDPNYKPIMNFDSYDGVGNILQQSEHGDIKESYIWDYNSTYPVAKGINAQRNEIAYTSFEADGNGQWAYKTAYVSSVSGITGKKSYSLPSGNNIHIGYDNALLLSKDRKYILSFWSKGGTAGVLCGNNTGDTWSKIAEGSSIKLSIGEWKYYEAVIENTTWLDIYNHNGSSSLLVDELRLYPVNAQMTTFTFDPQKGMTSQCDPNNRIVYYEYDSLQRLKLIKDQNGNVVKTFEYNYKR